MVQTRSFRRTIPLLTSGDQDQFDAAVEEIAVEANTFLASLDAVNVLDVGKIVTQVGKNGILAYIECWVTFKQ